jgi:phosphatidate phosphatase APP1
MATVALPYSELDPSQRAILYPMLGYVHRDGGHWRVLAQGRFYRQIPLTLSKRLLIRGLQRVMNVPRDQFREELFHQRLEGFLAAAEPGRRVVLQLGDERITLRKKTRSSGLFQSTLDIPTATVRAIAPEAEQRDCRVNVQLAVDPSNPHSNTFCSSLYFVAPTGLSVISDIDDTIKLTQVTQKRAMLANTFVHPFQAIEGMAEVYRQWETQGAFFHYVSSSPWQIYGALDDFFVSHQFPSGSMHLRWFRLRDEILRKWQLLRRRGKYAIIANLMRRYPQRQFILLGDSGESDPEIYARIAKRFASQISFVAIRQIGDRPLDGRRLQRVIHTSRKTPYLTFTHPHELPRSGSC